MLVGRLNRIPLLCAVAGTLAIAWTDSALATIVVNGRAVAAWPDVTQLSNAGASVPSTMAATGFFPRREGVIRGLTLLVDFSDQPHTFSSQEISDWLNLPGYNRFGLKGSVREYFYEVSNGHLDLQNYVFGYYRARKPKSHYESTPGYEGAGELLHEVIEHFDSEVDFSLFDNDKNGVTEAISIVYAGPSENWGRGIWPHSGWLGERHDNVQVNAYQMTNADKELGLYTFSHEVGHMVFGWPDLYGFGDYCLMGNWSPPDNPVGVNDFFRADQGWIPVVDAPPNGTYTASVNGSGYRYANPARPQEQFFWSNVQNTGRFSNLRGGGILMLHYDHGIRGNSPPGKLQLSVVQADGKDELGGTMWPQPGSDPADFFFGTRVTLSDDSQPSSRWNDGTPSGLRLFDISDRASQMSFAVSKER